MSGVKSQVAHLCAFTCYELGSFKQLGVQIVLNV